jgi:hypothetical protein
MVGRGWPGRGVPHVHAVGAPDARRRRSTRSERSTPRRDPKPPGSRHLPQADVAGTGRPTARRRRLHLQHAERQEPAWLLEDGMDARRPPGRRGSSRRGLRCAWCAPACPPMSGPCRLTPAPLPRISWRVRALTTCSARPRADARYELTGRPRTSGGAMAWPRLDTAPSAWVMTCWGRGSVSDPASWTSD